MSYAAVLILNMFLSYFSTTTHIYSSSYAHIMYTAIGEFGQVFKGTWVRMTSDGNTVSEVVAIKTIKSML